jgi:hypothetical protein
MTTDYMALRKEAQVLAQQLFDRQADKVADFTDRLMDIYSRVKGKDFLIIHNPGGWGNRALEQCLQWERSVVTGINNTIEQLGYTSLLIQYFRSGRGWRERLWDLREQYKFFASKVKIMAAEVEFITRHLVNLKVILVGISQGAAFSNAVMQQLAGQQRVYSIEFGMFFPHLSRRVVTERTLVLDSNGLVPDAVVRRDMLRVARAYFAAPLRWVLHLLRGRVVRFHYCVRLRGHIYEWGYPQVQQQVVDFLESNFNHANKAG